jgi:hypothetical protein
MMDFHISYNGRAYENELSILFNRTNIFIHLAE